MKQEKTKTDKKRNPPVNAVEPQKQGWGPVGAILLTVFIFFATQIIAGFVVLALFLLSGQNASQFEALLTSGPLPQFIYVLIVDALVIAGIYVLLRVKKMSFKDIGTAWPTLKDIGLALLGYGVYILAYFLILVLAKLLIPSLDLEQKQQLGFDQTNAIPELILIGLSLVILPPIVEELLCRGFLYTSLRNKLSVWPAAVITSVVFAVAHLQFGSNAPLLWVAAIDTFVLSMVLVYLRETTGKLGAPIMLHMFKNAVAFSLLFIFVVG